MKRCRALMAAGWAATTLATAAPGSATPPGQLKIIAIDVEGGAATLYITPEGHSLLVDAGWPAGMGGPPPTPGQPLPSTTPSSAERIVATARANGLTRIDHLIITHYHVDHVGGFLDLIGRMPIGDIIDHGPNREFAPGGENASSPQTLYLRYRQATRASKRRSLAAGETLRIDDLRITIVSADRALIARHLPGAGGAGAGCDRLETNDDPIDEENPRSLGFVATWGRARILSLADTTWDVEQKLVCPRNRIGRIDLMFADNHGTDNSNTPALLATVRPRVVIVADGPTKGARTATLRTLARWPGYAGVWQLHYATRNALTDNTLADQIANTADQPDAMNALQMLVEQDGAITVRNPRNGVERRYAARTERSLR